MLREKLDSLLRRRPFLPFRVHVKDGRIYEVPYRGMTLLAEQYIKIGIPITKGHHPICDHTEFVPLELIERIEESSDSQDR